MKKRGSSAVAKEEQKNPASKKQKTEEENTPASNAKGCGHKHEAPSSSITIAKKTRESKTDFKPLYMKHREIVTFATKSNPKFLDHSKLVALRHLLHSHPEGGFKEFETQKKMRETLL